MTWRDSSFDREQAEQWLSVAPVRALIELTVGTRPPEVRLAGLQGDRVVERSDEAVAEGSPQEWVRAHLARWTSAAQAAGGEPDDRPGGLPDGVAVSTDLLLVAAGAERTGRPDMLEKALTTEPPIRVRPSTGAWRACRPDESRQVLRVIERTCVATLTVTVAAGDAPSSATTWCRSCATARWLLFPAGWWEYRNGAADTRLLLRREPAVLARRLFASLPPLAGEVA